MALSQSAFRIYICYIMKRIIIFKLGFISRKCRKRIKVTVVK